MKLIPLAALICLALSGAAEAKTVNVEDGYFSPQKVTIKKGQKITWAWKGNDGHSVGVEKLNWLSPLGGNGFKWTKTFKKKGTFPFYCPQHPGMQGQVKVK